MTYVISKDFGFSAAHLLRGLPDGHPCGRLHGHNYTIRATLDGGLLDEAGMLLDYGLLAPFRDWLDDTLDHRYLNDIPPFDVLNPTAEHLAGHLASVLARVVAVPEGCGVTVGVGETPKTWAQVTLP